jgi:hypothetical protein
MEINIQVKAQLSEDNIVDAVMSSLTDGEKIKLALRFGDNGDLSYELRLLSKIIKLIDTLYPSTSTEDLEMSNISKKLLEILPLLDKII